MNRPRILVVDDKENFLSLFRRIVPPRVDVVCASDGERALELLLAQPFDLVISDIRMPGLDGLALLRHIREAGIDVEVILMTAYGTIPDAVQAMQFGATDYLTKPFDPDAAVAAIEQALARRHARTRTTEDEAASSEEMSTEDAPVPSRTPMRPIASLPYREAIAAERERVTREYLIALLRDVQGNVTQAAERAGIERESLHRLMKRHRVRAEDYRR